MIPLSTLIEMRQRAKRKKDGVYVCYGHYYAVKSKHVLAYYEHPYIYCPIGVTFIVAIDRLDDQKKARKRLQEIIDYANGIRDIDGNIINKK